MSPEGGGSLAPQPPDGSDVNMEDSKQDNCVWSTDVLGSLQRNSKKSKMGLQEDVIASVDLKMETQESQMGLNNEGGGD